MTISKPKPNLIIFYTDDQGTLDANCFGSTDLYTPTIDRLAADGTRFTQAYAHTVCCPSRAMLLTGRYPQRSGVTDWTQNRAGGDGTLMDLRETTMADILREAGYRTGIVGKWHLGGEMEYGPKARGFETYFGFRCGFIDSYRHCFLQGKGFHDLWDNRTEIDRTGEYFPRMQLQQALGFIDEHSDEPFFLYFAFNLPHYPEQPEQRFLDQLAHLPEPRRIYAATVATMDDQMGKILAKLEELGLRDDTIVIFMSDNGHSMETSNRINCDDHVSGYPRGHFYGSNGAGNTGKWIGHKGRFLEGGIRVPATLTYPRRLPAGVVRDQPITACDWLPTVLDLCGVEPPAGVELDGASVVPIVTDDAPSHHDVMHWMWQSNWATRRGDWKLIYVAGNADHRSRRNANDAGYLLVNLAEDDPEQQNHADEEPELVAELLALHGAWLSSVTPAG